MIFQPHRGVVRADGKVIGSCYPRHRKIEFRKFLRIDREPPQRFDDPYDSGQLWYAKSPESQSMVGKASSLSLPLHPDLCRICLHGSQTESSLNGHTPWLWNSVKSKLKSYQITNILYIMRSVK